MREAGGVGSILCSFTQLLRERPVAAALTGSAEATAKKQVSTSTYSQTGLLEPDVIPGNFV